MASVFASFWDFLGKILLYQLVTLPEVILLYPVTRRLARVPQSTRDFWLCTLLLSLNILTNRFVALWLSGLNIISSLIWFFLLFRFVYRKRGWVCFVVLIKMVVVLSLMEALCMVIFNLMGALGFDQNKLMILEPKDMFQWENMFYFSVMNTLAILVLLLLLAIWDRLWGQKQGDTLASASSRNWLYIRSILRLCALIITSLGMLTMPFALFGEQSLIQFLIANKDEYLILTLCSAGMIIIAFSYMLQDIRYILQLQRLTTLEQQQAISRSLLQNLRFFRHNMVNMLYGLEGVLISGDREKVTEYYNEMRERCALVNNENITALERVSNPSVSAVLLRGVDRARQLNLPINLYVQPEVRMSRVLSDSELCQVLGVLQDNAIEAAATAEEQHVSIEMRNVDDGVEILIRNTYSGEVSPETLIHGGFSTKEGHEGHGLSSCYDILKRRKGAFLNFWVTSQYVQAQLLLWR